MRYGSAYIYGLGPPEKRFDELVDQIEKSGMALAYGPTGKVIQVLLEGKQRITTQEGLRGCLANSDDVVFNFYLNGDISTTCSFVQVKRTIWRETYWLDGKTLTESTLVIEALTNLFKARAKEATAFAFIVDEYDEIHLDFSWDDFIFAPYSEPPEWPLCLGFSKHFLSTKSIPLEKYEREDAENYCILRRLSERHDGAASR